MDRKVVEVSSLSLSFSLFLSLSLSFSDYLPTYLHTMYVFIYRSISLSLSLSLFHLSICLAVYLSICLSIYLSLSLSLSLPRFYLSFFGNATKPSRFAHFCQGAQSLAPATRKHICTSKSAPYPSVFCTFDLEICFAPQRRALFRHLNFQKWSENGVLCTF